MKGDDKLVFEKKKLYSYVDVDDSTPISKLSVLDQIRLLIKQWTTDPANELKNEDIATSELLTLKANLQDYIYKATAVIRSGKAKNVVVTVDTKFRPVLYEVLNSADIINYYKVEIAQPEIEYDIPFNIMIKFTVKEN